MTPHGTVAVFCIAGLPVCVDRPCWVVGEGKGAGGVMGNTTSGETVATAIMPYKDALERFDSVETKMLTEAIRRFGVDSSSVDRNTFIRCALSSVPEKFQNVNLLPPTAPTPTCLAEPAPRLHGPMPLTVRTHGTLEGGPAK